MDPNVFNHLLINVNCFSIPSYAGNNYAYALRSSSSTLDRDLREQRQLGQPYDLTETWTNRKPRHYLQTTYAC